MAVLEFFKDDDGALSCMRLLSFMVTGVVLTMWVWGNLKAGHYVPLGFAEAGAVSASVGSKAAQGYFEYGGTRYE